MMGDDTQLAAFEVDSYNHGRLIRHFGFQGEVGLKSPPFQPFDFFFFNFYWD